MPGNAFPRRSTDAQEDQNKMATATAASQLRANLMAHISQLPSQPTSLPPSFITSFVRRCFPSELDQVDFPQALTAMDYLKDLEIRRRREVVAAFDKLGIERDDISHREKIARKYPGVLRWVMEIEQKERKVEALYSQVYVGLRQWTLFNELSLFPFNKANCLAMLNTLYPPVRMRSDAFVQPTAQLTPQILSEQRKAFFEFITKVEKNGAAILSGFMNRNKRPGDSSGWTSFRETLDNYLHMANGVIEASYEITGRGNSPTAASFGSVECEEEGRRKVDSAISFGSAGTSNRNSAQSHVTRPSTSSSLSTSSRNHSRQVSKEKEGLNKPLPPPKDDDVTITQKSSGSTLERIARELRKMKSRSNVKDEPRPRTVSGRSTESMTADHSEHPPPPPAKDRGLNIKRSLRRMRSSSAFVDNNGSRPSSRGDGHTTQDVPAFDVEDMKKRRQEWESQHTLRGQASLAEMKA
jgi:hypothetical protein